jgi:hypothetical protein
MIKHSDQRFVIEPFSLDGIYENSFSNFAFNSRLSGGYKLEKQIGELNRESAWQANLIWIIYLSPIFINGERSRL